MYYVCEYALYPIYEPAEGGYYYAGRTVEVISKCNTRRKAMKTFRKLAKEYKKIGEEEMYPVRVSYLSFFFKDSTGSHITAHGDLIGDGYGIFVTKGTPLKAKGYVPYE